MLHHDDEYTHPRFSVGVDLLVEMAMASFLGWQEKHVIELDRDWNEFVSGEDFIADLHVGMNKLDHAVSDALSVVSGPMTLSLDADMGEEVGPVLATIDQVVLLAEYLTGGKCQGVPREIIRRSVAIACGALVEHPVPCCRLIPINKWRKAVRKSLPEEVASLLPWYDRYCELSPMLLNTFVENLGGIAAGNFTMFRNNVDKIRVLYEEICGDADFLNELKGRAWVQQNLIKCLGESRAYALLYLIERTLDLAGEMDDKVTALGFQAVAAEALSNCGASEIEQLERIYLEAFCGPGLDDDARLEMFKKVEDGLPILTSAPTNTLGYHLHQWDKGKIDGRALAVETYKVWDEILVLSAERISKTSTPKLNDIIIDPIVKKFSDIPEWLQNAVESLKNFVDINTANIAGTFTPQAAIGAAASTYSIMMQAKLTDTKSGRVVMTIKRNGTGKIKLTGADLNKYKVVVFDTSTVKPIGMKRLARDTFTNIIVLNSYQEDIVLSLDKVSLEALRLIVFK